ncbi:unnamed protein product [Timema podura]|uniref:Uncharacterized protein n=1 Tax=Timema podura TaxID=61482 RepID=A0ABN7NS25_TIMPD|nr:unnamed protein product [Timema podura]
MCYLALPAGTTQSRSNMKLWSGLRSPPSHPGGSCAGAPRRWVAMVATPVACTAIDLLRTEEREDGEKKIVEEGGTKEFSTASNRSTPSPLLFVTRGVGRAYDLHTDLFPEYSNQYSRDCYDLIEWLMERLNIEESGTNRDIVLVLLVPYTPCCASLFSRPLSFSSALAQAAPPTLSTAWTAPQTMFSKPSMTSSPLYSSPKRTPVSIGSRDGHCLSSLHAPMGSPCFSHWTRPGSSGGYLIRQASQPRPISGDPPGCATYTKELIKLSYPPLFLSTLTLPPTATHVAGTSFRSTVTNVAGTSFRFTVTNVAGTSFRSTTTNGAGTSFCSTATNVAGTLSLTFFLPLPTSV